MDRFSVTLKDARLRNDFHAAIRGAGAFRLFKRQLTEYNLWIFLYSQCFSVPLEDFLVLEGQ